LPEYFDEQACLAFFNKQVPNFKQSKMVPITVKKGLSNLLTGNILIQTSDIQTIDKLLTLHGRKIDGYPLSCWLMGHEHLETDDYNSAFDPNIFVQ
jgi:hypothetical protein